MNFLTAIFITVGVLAGMALSTVYVTLIHDPHVIATAREGYVVLAEKTAAEAQAAEMERQRNAASQALNDYQKRATADQQTLKVANDNLESIIAADTGTDGCGWAPADIDWLRNHGSKAQ